MEWMRRMAHSPGDVAHLRPNCDLEIGAVFDAGDIARY